MPRCESTLPAEITAGLSFQATVSLAAYPAPDWTLAAYLRGAGVIDMTATASGTDHIFSADASTTAAWVKGTYWFVLRATNGSAVMEAGSGQLEVLPDFASITGVYDGRSQNQIALDALDAVIAKRATLDQQRYKINERELWRTPMADLLKLRAYYATQVSRERAKANGRSRFGRPVIVKFSEQ